MVTEVDFEIAFAAFLNAFGSKKPASQSTVAVIVAGGSSTRMGEGLSKQWLTVGGLPVIVHTLLAFERAKTIREIMEAYGYLADTHTAVALSAAKQYVEKTGDKKPMIVASTASPYKFAIDVYRSLYNEDPSDALAALNELSAKTNTEIPYPLRGIGERTVRFTDTVPSADMWKAVQKYLG